MGNTEYCVTTGFSKKFDRQFNLWDMRSLEAPVQVQNIDNSSGVIFPFYDQDSGLLFLAGKGDGNIRFYEFCDGQFFKCSNSYSTNKSGMAYGFYSKRSVDVLRHELMRALKLTDSTVEFISFCAPRKSEAFQEDLFPNTIGNVPAQSGEDWFMGQTKQPVLISMAPQAGRKTIQSKQVQQTLQNIKLQSKSSEKSNAQDQQQQSQQQAYQDEEQLPDANYLKQLQEKYELAKEENNNLREQQREQTIQINSLENELSLLQSQQQEKQENEQEQEVLQNQLKEIQALEEKIFQITSNLDTNQAENNQIQEKLNQSVQDYHQILQNVESQKQMYEELQATEQAKQQQREIEEENESEEIKEQKQSFKNLSQQNLALKSKLQLLQKEQQERKQNEDYQQVINILLNQEDKFVNELKQFLVERKGALDAIKQSM